MTVTTFQLDSGGLYALQLSRTASGNWQLLLTQGFQDDRYSSLYRAFNRHLVFRIDERECSFPTELDEITLPSEAQTLEVWLGQTKRFRLAQCLLDQEPVEFSSIYQLSPFETRFLAQNGFPHPIGPQVSTFHSGLVTDLHTHFAGCITARDLLHIGLEYGVTFPASLLEEAGIHLERPHNIPLSSFSPELLKLLESRLAVPVDRRVTFLDMERIYRLRIPITKHPDTFLPMCRQIARDYQAMGVTYLELSLSNSVEASRLRLIHQHLPSIEAETGLQVRFLAAMSRHNDWEWDLDYIAQLKHVGQSRYIVGVDVMGHETNSTHAFTRQLKMIAEWAHEHRPGFVIRVHAGENPAHPENIRVAFEAVQGYNIQLRIGHGLFGVDHLTLQQMKNADVMVEFNLNSNLALNNIQTSREVPLLGYLEHGVPVVLGTDGYGIYQTSLEMEARAALIAGLQEADFVEIRRTEAWYLDRRQAWDESSTPIPEMFVVPDDLPHEHYTPEIMARSHEAKQLRDATLTEHLEILGIPVLDLAGVRNLLQGKQCISFAGAWAKSWSTISTENQKKIHTEIQKLLEALDPQTTVLITGGTHFGVEHVVQQCARERGFTVLGMLVRAIPPSSIEAGTITHAYLVAEKLYNKAAGLYQLMKDRNGLCLFIGGGNIVSDEIQTACNLRLRYLLMDGIEGASSLHAGQHPDNTFTCAEEVLQAMQDAKPWTSNNAPYWHLGPNYTVDIVLTRNHPQNGHLEVLLIRRDDDSPTEPGKWALPGGFQHTEAPRGTPWTPGAEAAETACLRELLEETSLDIRHLESELIPVGVYEGGGRDPRDTSEAWSRSTVFALHLPDALATSAIAGADDACDAAWIPVDPFPSHLAFDHNQIIKDGLAKLEEFNRQGRS